MAMHSLADRICHGGICVVEITILCYFQSNNYGVTLMYMICVKCFAFPSLNIICGTTDLAVSVTCVKGVRKYMFLS